MEKKEYEEKRARFAELLSRKEQIEAECSKIVTEMGYKADETGEHHREEFWDILRPAGFYVYQADKVEDGEKDTYILKVERIFPKFRNEGISDVAGRQACQGESHCPGN